jgi:macrolide-specific efflux system membrane fusion protein
MSAGPPNARLADMEFRSDPDLDDRLTSPEEESSRQPSPVRTRHRVLRKRTWIIGAAIVVLVAVVGCILLVANPFAPAPVAKTATATVETGTVTTTVDATGAIAAAATSNASFSAPGTITGIAVAVGQSVVAGQDLATIDSADADRALAKAQGALNAAETALDNSRASYSLTRTDLANARATRDATPFDSPEYSAAVSAVSELENALTLKDTDVANAATARDDAARDVDAAQSERDKTVLKASINGVVTAINGTVGSVTVGGGSSSGPAASTDASSPAGATAGSGAAPTGLITISDTSSLFVSAAIPEADIGAVALAQAATVTMAGDPSVAIAGSVTSIAPTPQTDTAGVVTFAAMIQLTTPPETVKLGETGFVSIVTASATDVLTLPASAVTMTAPGEGTVQLAPKKKSGTAAKTVPVKVGLSGDGVVEITEGLALSDVVQIPTPPDGGTGADVGGSTTVEGS